MIAALLAVIAGFALFACTAAPTVGSWSDAMTGAALLGGGAVAFAAALGVYFQLRSWRMRRRYRLRGDRVVNLDAGRRARLGVVKGGRQ